MFTEATDTTREQLYIQVMYVAKYFIYRTWENLAGESFWQTIATDTNYWQRENKW